MPGKTLQVKSEELHRKLKIFSAQKNIPITDLVERYIMEGLRRDGVEIEVSKLSGQALQNLVTHLGKDTERVGIGSEEELDKLIEEKRDRLYQERRST